MLGPPPARQRMYRGPTGRPLRARRIARPAPRPGLGMGRRLPGAVLPFHCTRCEGNWEVQGQWARRGVYEVGAVPGKPCPEEIDGSRVDTRVLFAKRAVFLGAPAAPLGGLAKLLEVVEHRIGPRKLRIAGHVQAFGHELTHF
jgi:hypothetical protein